MTRLSPRKYRARRALIDDTRSRPTGWLQHGIGALAVTALGSGVAASVALTGSATSITAVPQVVKTVTPGVAQPTAFDHADQTTSRTSFRPPLTAAAITNRSQNRASALTEAAVSAELSAQQQAVVRRQKALAATSAATEKEARSLAAAAKRDAADGTGSGAAGKACLPLAGYTVAARFGDVGAWARYHTGFDFSAPIGTSIHAPTAGVVTNAGSGPAGGWAGNYVTIRYADGTQTLMAHMSRVTVGVGEQVSACEVVGAVGMTGRAFGPHLHFEVYPAGIEPGDIYRAVNPVPWLNRLGLKP